jgi:ABC-type branched-subunit amino acid transport system ATPase component
VTNLLEVDGLTVRYGGNVALDRVSFNVPEGAFVGLIGPNGAGKTTLIDALTGFVPCSGHVRFDGVSLDGRRPHARTRLGMGRTFQGLELFEDLTVHENLLVGAEHSRWWSFLADSVRPRISSSARRDVTEALELLGISDTADCRPQELSLGRRKLVTVARALAARPRLVLLDEPAAGLDSDESLALGEILRTVVANGTTILLVDHDMGLVMGVCDQIHVLDFGKHIAGGPPETVRKNEAVIHAYLGNSGSKVGA